MDKGSSDRFVYTGGELECYISQCKHCKNAIGNASCSVYKEIPFQILVNEVKCEQREEKEE